MEIIRLNPSDRVRQALAAGVDNFSSLLDPALVDALRKSEGLPVYSLTRQSVATGGDGIMGVIPRGWRFMVQAENRAGAGHIRELPDDTAKMSRVSEGDAVLRAIEICNGLENLSEVPKNCYELRILKVPSVPIEVFWLRAEDGNDVVVPFGSATATLENGRAYPLSKFLREIRPIADARLEFDKSQESKDA